MSKHEFMNQLRSALAGEIPEREILSYLNYYEDYFNENRSREREVIEELGEPRLLAKTIIESYQSKNQGSRLKNQNATYSREDNSNENEQPPYQFLFHTDGKIPLKYKVYGIVGSVFALFILFLLLRLVFALAVRVVLPILLLVLVIMGISYLSKK